MPLQNYQYDTIMREYSRRQAQSRYDLEQRRTAVYEELPRLKEIDRDVASLSSDQARALLGGPDCGLDDMKASITLHPRDRMDLLDANAYPEDYRAPH